MSEHILNMFPLNPEERPLFESLMPDAVWEYPHRTTVTDEQLANATIIMGWPKASYCSPQWLYQFTFPPTVYKGSLFSASSPTFAICAF